MHSICLNQQPSVLVFFYRHMFLHDFMFISVGMVVGCWLPLVYVCVFDVSCARDTFVLVKIQP